MKQDAIANQSRRAVRKKRFLRSTLSAQQKRTSYLFLLIPTLLLLVFTYYPALKLVELSFTDWNGRSAAYDYVGPKQYIKVFTDPKIIRSFVNTFAYVAIGVIQTFLAFYLAIILNTNIRGRNFLRSLFIVPYVLNGVAVSYMFNYIYNFNTNPINYILTQLGLQDYCIHWLGDSYLSNLALAFIGLWRFTGYGMILYIGALQSIPSSLFEAAELDGAGFWHTIRHIVVPEIRPVIGLNLFLNINGSLQAFDQAFVITKGGPNGATETFVTGTLKTAFDYSNFGKASAMGVVLLAICIIVQLAQKLLLKGEQE